MLYTFQSVRAKIVIPFKYAIFFAQNILLCFHSDKIFMSECCAECGEMFNFAAILNKY